MLKTTKQIQITGASQINNEQAVYMSATLNSNGESASITKSITNREVYEINKTEIRKDMHDFEILVYQMEDEIGGNTNA